MLKIERTVLPSPEQWEIIIEGMRNPMNSWDKSDSGHAVDCGKCGRIEREGICTKESRDCTGFYIYDIGKNDHDLMMRLAKGGAVHAKYRRMIPVFVTINAPLYWWKEFDTYKVGTVANSCSTMHKIHSKEFTLDDFSCEYLIPENLKMMEQVVKNLNAARNEFINYDSSHFRIVNDSQVVDRKVIWEQMIQLLPTSYNQKRTIMLNYEVLVNIYHSRKDHKLDEWHTFCDWIKGLPYSELIVGDC